MIISELGIICAFIIYQLYVLIQNSGQFWPIGVMLMIIVLFAFLFIPTD